MFPRARRCSLRRHFNRPGAPAPARRQSTRSPPDVAVPPFRRWPWYKVGDDPFPVLARRGWQGDAVASPGRSRLAFVVSGRILLRNGICQDQPGLDRPDSMISLRDEMSLGRACGSGRAYRRGRLLARPASRPAGYSTVPTGAGSCAGATGLTEAHRGLITPRPSGAWRTVAGVTRLFWS